MKSTGRDGVRKVWAMACVLSAGLATGLPAVLTSAAQAQPVAQATRADADEWARAVWRAASADGAGGRLDTLLSEPPSLQPLGLSASIATLDTNLEAREALRATEASEAGVELDELLTKVDAGGEGSAIALSDALVATVRLHLLTPINERGTYIAQPRTQRVIALADAAAHDAESRGDWLMANELYYRLNALLDTERTYKADSDRLIRRLDILRLFVPERLWELRNEREIAEGNDPLPPYNPFGDSYQVKLDGVSERAVVNALKRASVEHVEHVSGTDLALGALDGVATLASTKDIARVFPGVADEASLREFLGYLQDTRREIQARGTRVSFERLVAGVLDANDTTIGLPHAAILHELGNGAVSRLDEFSQIIWPDELAQFQKATQGRFVGIGVQIQQDERSNIVVVTPLEGTPAQRAGVHAGDIIKAVDGRSIVGFGLSQAVSVITGEPGSIVRLTVERQVDGQPTDVDIEIPRAQIAIGSVKGWERTGARDDEWNWFIDEQAGIGYVRLTGFVDTTDREFDAAVRQMRHQGLNALILDLRFNPGGLLSQAVEIANRFIPGRNATIVSTADASGAIDDSERAVPGRATVADIPVIVLVNEGSASASEIVAGAVQSYAHQGTIDALVVGERSFGKGSVQNVYFLPGQQAAMRLTTHYYLLPNGRRVHRLPGSTDWGVNPDLRVEMLPSQIEEAANLRRDADVLPIDETGQVVDTGQARPDPDDLLARGLDLQLEYALVLLQSRSEAPTLGQVPQPQGEPVSTNN